MNYKKLLLLVGSIFSALLLIVCFANNADASRSGSYIKNGHTWYKGKTKSYDVEVMDGTYQYNPKKGTVTVPKNKSKHFKLYTIDNIPAEPNKNPNISKISGMNFNDATATLALRTGSNGWNKMPFQLHKDMYAWTVMSRKRVILRIAGQSLKYPMDLSSINNTKGKIFTIVSNATPDNPIGEQNVTNVVLPDNGTTPDSPNAQPLKLNLPINLGITTASFGWYFGGKYNNDGVQYGYQNYPSTISVKENSLKTDVLLDSNPQTKTVTMAFNDFADDGYVQPGTKTFSVYYSPATVNRETLAFHAAQSLKSSFSLQLSRGDNKTYNLSQTDYFRLVDYPGD